MRHKYPKTISCCSIRKSSFKNTFFKMCNYFKKMCTVFLDLHGGLAVDTGGAAAHPQAVTRLNHRLNMKVQSLFELHVT
jgi:hypothetical protein